jgi:hypothetical protein
MKHLTYKISKIAEAQKLLIEVLESKIILNQQQNESFGIKYNNTMQLMRETAAEYLTLKNKSSDKITNTNTYISEHIKEVEKALHDLKKELKLKFSRIRLTQMNDNKSVIIRQPDNFEMLQYIFSILDQTDEVNNYSLLVDNTQNNYYIINIDFTNNSFTNILNKF